MTATTDRAVSRVGSWVAKARAVTVLTGAGISTASGIPDFRGPDGLWTRDPEAERLSSLDAYLGDAGVRRRVWQGRLRHPAWTARPNPAHLALVELERSGRLRALVTQNIDGLHQLAGTSGDVLIEIHGTLRDVVCLFCGRRSPAGPTLERVRAGEADPACEDCGGILKSATVSFGQALDPGDLQRAQEAAASCELFIAAGTSLTVYPVALLPEIALASGARLVILNAQPTPYDDRADEVIRAPLAEVLPAIVRSAAPG